LRCAASAYGGTRSTPSGSSSFPRTPTSTRSRSSTSGGSSSSDEGEALRFYLVLLPLLDPALAVAPTDGGLNAPILRGLRHTHAEQLRVAQLQLLARLCGLDAHGREDLPGHGARERGRHGVSDLTSAVPLGLVEAEPVREAVQSRHLSDGDAAVILVMDRARTGERAARRISAGAQGVRHAVRRQLQETRDGLHLSRCSLGESP